MGQSECAVIEITKEDLERMRGGVVYDKREKFLEEKRKLKALSDERAQRWPNTIEALRIKRLQAQKEELERIEIERATKLLLLPHMKEAISKHHINTIIKASKEEERNMTREMDRKMEEYAAEREKINQEKKKQEAAKGALRGVRFDAMIEKQRQMLREAKEDDEKRYHCAKRGIESEQDARLQTEALKRQKDWEECDISRKKQVELKKRQQENEKEDERFEAKQVEEHVFKIKSELDAFQKDCFAKNRSVAEANKHAVEAKIKKEMQDKEDNIYDAKSAFQRIKNDEYVNIPLEFLKLC